MIKTPFTPTINPSNESSFISPPPSPSGYIFCMQYNKMNITPLPTILSVQVTNCTKTLSRMSKTQMKLKYNQELTYISNL